MTNKELLEKKIASCGVKKSYIAKKLGVTRETLRKKINNITPFNQYEIEDMCNILRITDLNEKELIFFAKDVDK